ncbi:MULTISPECIES: Abi family protein [Bacteroides]|uniref:Abi family protein n=2 Tax=Bacteroidales TaxID=171549 RepID=UPI00265A907B|nr:MULTISPECIES: Abi family protein [Bacteroides]
MANKESRTVEEQITLLKSRGMLIRDEAAALHHLAHISYYRLKGYWWDMQSDRINHTFLPNVYLEDVLTRYYFDKELRLILFDAIETIEIALRTKMIYHLSQAFGGLWYRDATLFTDINLHAQQLKELEEEFLRSGEIFVKDYKRKHLIKNDTGQFLDEHPDAWIIFEVATFGTLSKMYKNLRHQLPQKSLIANEMGLNFHNELSGWLEAISYLRNIIAHHSRIWSRNMVKRPAELHNPRMTWLSRSLTEVQQKKPFYLITAMLYLCNAIDSRHTFKQKLLNLFQQHPDIPIYKIGFFNHWEQEPIWKQ